MPKNLIMPKESIYKTEEVRYLNTEIPTYEEFLKTYQVDEKVSVSYMSEIDGLEKGYGPCYKCGESWITFELEIVLKNSRGGWKKSTVYDIVDACKTASEIKEKKGFWNDNNPSFSSRERNSLVDRIISAVDEHVRNSRNIDRTVTNDVVDSNDDCSIL